MRFRSRVAAAIVSIAGLGVAPACSGPRTALPPRREPPSNGPPSASQPRPPAGAAAAVHRPPSNPTPPATAGLPAAVRETLGFSAGDRPIDLFRVGSGREVVLVLATIHGDEDAGTPLVLRLAAELRRDAALASGRTVLLVPVANPDGRAARRRANARGIDLNRNFPAPSFRASRHHGPEPLSEPETRALRDLILRWRPARIVSIHQPRACVDWDGPAEELARRIAASGPLEARRLGPRPGSLGSWAGERLGIPCITLELPAGAENLDKAERWRRFGPTLLAAVRG